jgi:hypothetical protein
MDQLLRQVQEMDFSVDFPEIVLSLMLWVLKKYKISSIKVGYVWLKNCQKLHPNLFAHWRHGFIQRLE